MTRGMLLVLVALTASAPLSVDVYTPSLPAIEAQLGGGAAFAEGTVTACLLGIAVGQLVWGPLSDRIGRRPVVLWGAIGWTVASLLSAVSVSGGMLLGARVLSGLCGAAGIVVARSIVRDVARSAHDISSTVGLLAMATAIAPIVAPVIGTGIALLWGWRADFVALTVAGAAMIAGVLLLVPETIAQRYPSPINPVPALRDRQVRAAALSIGVFSLGFYAYVSSASFIVERQYGLPSGMFALAFGTNAAAMLASNAVFRRISRTRHPSFALRLGLAIAACGGAGMAVFSAVGMPRWTVWIASTAFTAGAGLVMPSAHSWAQLTPVAAGAASAATGALQFVGGVLGSPVTGLVGVSAAALGILIVVGAVLGLGAASARHAPR